MLTRALHKVEGCKHGGCKYAGQWQLNQLGEEESGSFSRLHNSTQKPEEISAVPKEVVETPKGKPAAKKRGRPGRKDNKEWQDDEIFVLINIWSTKEELFNCRDEKYQIGIAVPRRWMQLGMLWSRKDLKLIISRSKIR